jgi:hypothetical protein
VSTNCQDVRRALEEDAGRIDPDVMAHLSECGRCARHAGLVELLGDLEPGEAGDATVRELLLGLPLAPWQLRRPATWAPLAAGVALSVGGVALLGGVPAGGTILALPGAAYSFVASSAVDLLTAARGSADALRVVVGSGGAAAMVWLGLTALAGSLAVRALLRQPARGRA